MSKRRQYCDGCGIGLRHGFPYLRKLFCSQTCLAWSGRRKERSSGDAPSG